MNCLIIDDNEIARTALRQLTRHVKELDISGEFADAAQAYKYLLNNKVDLLLLDIEMPGMTGLELTKNLQKDGPLIIFTTSSREHALEAFELNVVDYILKPVMPERFIQAIDKAKEIFASRNTEVKSEEDEFLFIRDSNIIRRLKTADILYAEAMGDYVKLHTGKKFYAIHATLKSVELRLPPNLFLRIHRSYIIALNKIDMVKDGSVIINGKSLHVADAYRNLLNKRINLI